MRPVARLMDSTRIQQRNYQLVEKVRRQNLKEQKQLEELINSAHGISSVYRFNIDEVEREKRVIRRELKRIKQSTYTTKGELPPKHLRYKLKPLPEESVNQRGKKTKKQEKYQEKTEEDSKVAQEKLKNFTHELMDRAHKVDDDLDNINSVMRANKNRRKSLNRASIADLSLTDAKVKVAKRLTASAEGFYSNDSPAPVTSRSYNFMESLHKLGESVPEANLMETDGISSEQINDGTSSETGSTTQRQKKKKKSKSEDGEELVFDADLYHPDGRLRTLHRLPDFVTTIKQAKKARYVRHKEKQWFEKELSVGEIFPVTRKEATKVGQP